MKVRNKVGLGDMPTLKLSQEELARSAREAEQLAIEQEAAERATFRPAPPSYPDIDVSVEVADGSFDGIEGVLQEGGELRLNASLPPIDIDRPREGSPTPLPDELPNKLSEDHHSDVRLAVSGGTQPTEGPEPTLVPCVVASKEDLSWFALEDAAQVVLAMIDGESTVETIVSTLTLPRANVLTILRELLAHGVIEFH